MTKADIAMKFFDACEMGKGWDACKEFCAPGATFSCQSDELAGVKTIEHYTKWMKGSFKLMPDAGYDLKALAIDEKRNAVCICAVFNGTFTGEGGLIPPTGKSMNSDYAYLIEFEGDKIRHLTKFWNGTFAMKQVGLA
jgi:predicted ester cyclase